MSAFLDLLSAYAIWIYIVGVVGILFGIKMLVDSRRLARTTLFTLEQEQAGELAFRAIVVMVVFGLLIGGVSAVNAFIAPARPTPIPLIARQTTVAFTPVLILPTFTTVPTLTPEPPTEAPTEPPTREAPPTVQATVPPITQPPLSTKAPTPPPASYPAPVLVAPLNGESISKGRIQFRWDTDPPIVPVELPAGQSYRVTVYYTDRDTNQRREPAKCSQFSTTDTTHWDDLLSAEGKAVDRFYWFVVVVQLPNTPNANCYNGTPISPQSEVHTFKWF
jgi:hypothetical protein